MLEDEQHRLALRVAALEEPQARPSIGLSPQRLGQVYLLERRLRAEQGRRVGGTLEALASDFGVEDVSDLPESVWPHVLVWFDYQLAKG